MSSSQNEPVVLDQDSDGAASRRAAAADARGHLELGVLAALYMGPNDEVFQILKHDPESLFLGEGYEALARIIASFRMSGQVLGLAELARSIEVPMELGVIAARAFVCTLALTPPPENLEAAIRSLLQSPSESEALELVN